MENVRWHQQARWIVRRVDIYDFRVRLDQPFEGHKIVCPTVFESSTPLGDFRACAASYFEAAFKARCLDDDPMENVRWHQQARWIVRRVDIYDFRVRLDQPFEGHKIVCPTVFESSTPLGDFRACAASYFEAAFKARCLDDDPMENVRWHQQARWIVRRVDIYDFRVRLDQPFEGHKIVCPTVFESSTPLGDFRACAASYFEAAFKARCLDDDPMENVRWHQQARWIVRRVDIYDFRVRLDQPFEGHKIVCPTVFESSTPLGDFRACAASYFEAAFKARCLDDDPMENVRWHQQARWIVRRVDINDFRVRLDQPFEGHKIVCPTVFESSTPLGDFRACAASYFEAAFKARCLDNDVIARPNQRVIQNKYSFLGGGQNEHIICFDPLIDAGDLFAQPRRPRGFGKTAANAPRAVAARPGQDREALGSCGIPHLSWKAGILR